MSNLEETVKAFLKRNKIDFVYQKKFSFIGRKSLDFYLPKYKTAIECQGIQHYKCCHFFNSEKQQKRDCIKLKECQNNDIKIVYYTNYKYKKIIPSKLKNKTFFNLKLMLDNITNGI